MLSALRLVPRSDRSAMTGVLPTRCPRSCAWGFTGHNAAVKFNVPGSADADRMSSYRGWGSGVGQWVKNSSGPGPDTEVQTRRSRHGVWPHHVISIAAHFLNTLT